MKRHLDHLEEYINKTDRIEKCRNKYETQEKSYKDCFVTLLHV